MGNISIFQTFLVRVILQAWQSYTASWRLAVYWGLQREIQLTFETWGWLQPKLLFFFFLFFFTGYTNSVFSLGVPKLLKVPPMLRDMTRCTSIVHHGLGGSPVPVVVAVEARLVLKSVGPAWSALTRAVQFILSYFPGTSGKQTMHCFKYASMKQLGCIELFLL